MRKKTDQSYLVKVNNAISQQREVMLIFFFYFILLSLFDNEDINSNKMMVFYEFCMNFLAFASEALEQNVLGNGGK